MNEFATKILPRLFRSVLNSLLSLESEVRPIKCFNISSLFLFCAIECPVFQININVKKVLIRMKQILIDFSYHQLVPQFVVILFQA